MVAREQRLQGRDYGILVVFCLVLFGHALVVGGSLTMHEGVLSQTSRAMYEGGDWIVPRLGQAPWLERPPLPQWITVAIASVIGRCDAEWIVRIGPILTGAATVLITGWLAGACFGRAIGLLSGLILASMYQFARYATLAEADIFLTPIVAGVLALFAHLEFSRSPRRLADSPLGLGEEDMSFAGRRPWPVLAFFVLLGLTNLAKGLVFGTAMALIPIAAFMLWNLDVGGVRRYVWLWGGLIGLLIALAWPIAVCRHYPDAVELWSYDLLGRLGGHYLEEPAWYYLAQLPWILLPWTPLALWGLWLTRGAARGERGSPERLLWCWAIFPMAVFSFAQGKHHHYLIHSMAPWAIFTALATVRVWEMARGWPRWVRHPLTHVAVVGVLGDAALLLVGDKLPGPGWLMPALLITWPLVVFGLGWSWGQRNGGTAAVTGFSLLVALYWAGFAYKARYLHKSHDDTTFLHEALARTDPRRPLLVNSYDNALEGLRILFYLQDRGRPLHNLTFLLDDALATDVAYVITRFSDKEIIAHFGEPEVIVQSQRSRRETSPEDRWTLFRVVLDADLPRQPGNVRISPMQAMYREDGPFLE